MHKMIVVVLLTVLVAVVPGAAVPTAAIAPRQVQTTVFKRYMMSSSQDNDTNDIMMKSFDATVDASSSQPAAANYTKGYCAVGKLSGKQQR
jgi:hypothetical protein